ncbi:MAG: hypothetical protein DRP45_04430 [Candidatus Zixiibacteriota bacterium]|nr:MAG: hypothetical protein DRP45_04430 [candidate division Zixibacteria bacterium]
MPKKKTTHDDKLPKLVYADGDTPPIEFSDFVKLAPGSHGILFSFGQSHPYRKEVTLTYEVILPFATSASLYQILGEQLQKYSDLIQQLESSQENDASSD